MSFVKILAIAGVTGFSAAWVLGILERMDYYRISWAVFLLGMLVGGILFGGLVLLFALRALTKARLEKETDGTLAADLPAPSPYQATPSVIVVPPYQTQLPAPQALFERGLHEVSGGAFVNHNDRRNIRDIWDVIE